MKLARGVPVAVALSVGLANAATLDVDWGEHAPLPSTESSSEFFTLATDSFVATYRFTVDLPGVLAATLGAIQLPPALSVSFTQFALFEGIPSDPLPLLPKASFSTAGNSATGPISLEQSGSYFYVVKGDVTGVGNSPVVFAPDVAGGYVVTSTFAPVPEPGTWALMAAGMLFLWMAVRGRRRD